MALDVATDQLTTITARGPLSATLLEVLTDRAPERAGELPALAQRAAGTADAIHDDDLQMSLFLMYAVAYGSLPQLGAHWEWDTQIITARTRLEAPFEQALRAAVSLPAIPEPTRDAVAETLFAMTAPQAGPSLSRFVSRKATVEQARELLIQRSVYTLREADPHSWAIPRLTGRAKVALVEIQSDEYGGGRPDRMHQSLYARTMRGARLDDTYGRYADAVPAITLASLNAMSLFGLHRRLRGACAGHLAAFEMTSSLPCKAIAEGLRRIGFGDDVADYYDEHVEADAVHEQIAGRDLAGSLAEDEPDLLPDILFGAAACLTVDGWAADHVLECWQRGRSSLRAAGQAPA